MVRIATLFYVIDACLVNLLYLHAAGTVYHALGVNENAHVGDMRSCLLPFRGGRVRLFKENEVAGLRLVESGYLTSLLRLLRSIAEQFLAEETHDDLTEARAVHAQGVLAAPEVGYVEEETGDLQEVLLAHRAR